VSTSIGILIDRAGGGTEGNLAMDKGEGRVETVLGSAEGAEWDMD